MVEIHISLAKAGHISELSKLHFSSLPDDFLPSLGLDFLQNEYYPAALASSHAVTYVVTVEDNVVGFVTVAHESSAFTRDILQGHAKALIKYALRAALHEPMHILKSIQVFWSAVLAKPEPIPGEIVFIAVDESYRNCGIGKRMIREALEYLYHRKVGKCRTKTLARNEHVIAMYKRLGWNLARRFRLIGKEYVVLVGSSFVPTMISMEPNENALHAPQAQQ